MSSVMYGNDWGDSITEIESHGNMVVVAKHETILYDIRNKVNVIPFTLDYQVLEKVSIVEV